MNWIIDKQQSCVACRCCLLSRSRSNMHRDEEGPSEFRPETPHAPIQTRLADEKAKSITLTGFIMFTIFFALMASAGAQSREEVWAYPVFLGLGLGVVTSTRESVQGTSNPRH